MCLRGSKTIKQLNISGAEIQKWNRKSKVDTFYLLSFFKRCIEYFNLSQGLFIFFCKIVFFIYGFVINFYLWLYTVICYPMIFLNKVLLFENAGFVIYFEQKYFVEGIFRKRPSKECALTLSALVDRGFIQRFEASLFFASYPN